LVYLLTSPKKPANLPVYILIDLFMQLQPVKS